MPASIANELSGHSMRIGAAQDMLVAGFDALAIMQAGGWKSTNVVLRYVENASTRKLHERSGSVFSEPNRTDAALTRTYSSKVEKTNWDAIVAEVRPRKAHRCWPQ